MILVLLVLVPSVGVQAVNELLLYHDREKDVRSLAQRSADIYNTQLDQVANGLRKLLAAVAELPAVKSLDAAACDDALRGLSKRYREDVVLAATDLAGRVRCSSASVSTPISMADRPLFAAAKKGFTLGTFTTSRLDGRPSLPFARPILTRTARRSA